MGIEEDGIMRGRPQARNDVDVFALGRAIKRRKLWVAAPVLACFLASTVAVTVIKPRYTAEAKILLENQESFFTQPDRADRAIDALPDEEAVQSQVQLVSSRDLARKAIKVLDLQGNPEFDPLADGLDRVSRLLVLLGLERDPLRAAPEDRILSSFAEKLTVYPVVKSRVLTLQFTSLDPDLAAKAANTVSMLYIGLQSEAKRDSAHAAATSLATLIAKVRDRVAAADSNVQAYRAETGLLLGANNTTITAQQLADVNGQLAQARTTQADSEAKAKLLRDMIKVNRIAEVPDVANNDMIRRVFDQRMLVKTQIAQQSQTLLPGHPRMQELNAQLADIDRQMRAAADQVVRTLENDAKISAGRVENLTAALDVQKKTASAAGADEVTLNTLELQAKLLKDQLEFNTQKYQEAVARENAVTTPADARVISRAVAPSVPSFPRKGPMIAILTLAGLVLSIGLVVARELLSGRAFVRESEPEGMPVQLAERSFHGEERFEAVPRAMAPGLASGPASEVAPDLLPVLTSVERRATGRGGVRTMVTGADGDAAVGAAALRIARALAREHRVILVDCGAGAGDVEAVLAFGPETSGTVDPRPGLLDLLSGTTSFAEVIHRDPLTRLHLVPMGTARADVTVDAFATVVDALAETYDHVIFVAPQPAEDVLPVADRVDLAILIETQNAAPDHTEARRAALQAAGATDVVVVPLAPSALDEEVSAA